MRIFALFLSLILAPATVFAQLPDEGPNRRQPTNTNQQAINLLEGFAESSWGESYANMREKFLSLSTNSQNDEKVEIVFEDKEKTLLIRRNGILYSYRFYSTPKIVIDSRPKDQRSTTPTAENRSELEDENHSAPGVLFSVGVLFRYLPGKDVQQKLEQKYGKPKKESLAENKIGGAVLWEKTDEKQSPPKGGYVVQWKEAYKKMPFTRRVDYFSSSIKFQIEKEYKEFFSAEEIKTLRDLIP